VSCFLTSVYPARVVPVFISELEHPRFKEFDLSSLRTGIMGTPSPPNQYLHLTWLTDLLNALCHPLSGKPLPH
jgi:hypothetical protein